MTLSTNVYGTTPLRLLAGACVAVTVFPITALVASVVLLEDARRSLGRLTIQTLTQAIAAIPQSDQAMQLLWFGFVLPFTMPVWLLLAYRGRMSGLRIFTISTIAAAAVLALWAIAAIAYLMMTYQGNDNVYGAPVAMLVVATPVVSPLIGLASWAGWRIAYRRVDVKLE